MTLTPLVGVKVWKEMGAEELLLVLVLLLLLVLVLVLVMVLVTLTVLVLLLLEDLGACETLEFELELGGMEKVLAGPLL